MLFSKFIRLTLIVLAVGSFTLLSAQAEHRGQRGSRGPGFDAEKLKADLNLTDDQVKEIEELTAEQRKQMQALRNMDFESREDRRKAMKAIMDDYQSDLNEILTDEQEAKMKALRQEHREKRQEKGESFRENRKVMREDIESYREEQVIPVLRTQRAKLENKISAQDKATITELRTQRPERPKRLESPTPAQQKAAKEQFHARKEEMKVHKEKVEALVKKYESDIDALFAEIEPQTTKWHKDMKKIAQENRPEGVRERKRHDDTPEGAHKAKRKAGKRGMHAKRGEHEKPLMHKGAFLLLDPNATPATTPNTQEALTEIKVFPNPAFNQNTLSYTVKKAGHLRIELHNESGRLIETLFDGTKAPGEYQLDVDMSKLRNGVYYYTVIDQSGKQSHKVVVNK